MNQSAEKPILTIHSILVLLGRKVSGAFQDAPWREYQAVCCHVMTDIKRFMVTSRLHYSLNLNVIQWLLY